MKQKIPDFERLFAEKILGVGNLIFGVFVLGEAIAADGFQIKIFIAGFIYWAMIYVLVYIFITWKQWKI